MPDKSVLPVSEFMVKNVVYVKQNATINQVSKKMYENHVGAAVIVENDLLKGIVTYRDIAMAITIFEKSSNLPVSKIMSSPVLHIPPEESIIKVAEIMTNKNIHRLAVVDQGKLIGIISSFDLAILFSMSKEENLKKTFGAYLNK